MNEWNGPNIRIIVKYAVLLAGTLLLIYIAFRLAFYLAPFLVAFAIATLMEPVIRFFMSRLRFPRKAAVAVALLLLLSTLGLVVTWIAYNLISEIVSLSNYINNANINDVRHYFYEVLSPLFKLASDLYAWLPQEMIPNINKLVSDLSETVLNAVKPVLQGVFNTAISIPEALIFILVTILSTFFFASDRSRIHRALTAQIPESWIHKLRSLKNDLFSAFFGYLRAQLILMSITFTELSIGFSIIGIKYALLLALIASLVDALPVLGTGSLLIPWALYEFITADYRMGTSLLILYLVVLVVRQLIEPKILSQQIGIHPLVTLMAMYSGLQLLGVLGMILGPITVLVLKNIISGILKNRTLAEVFMKQKPSHPAAPQNKP